MKAITVSMITIVTIVVSGIYLVGCEGPTAISGRDASIEKSIDRLVGQMTLEEKVGQMTQVTLEVVSNQKAADAFAMDMQKLREAIVTHHVGSILNCGGEARDIETWHKVITAIQDVALQETRLKIPVIYGIDSIHGANYVLEATIFPQSFALAATGNVELVRKVGEITAYETRAAGLPWNFSPVLGLGRQPKWPRFFETFGEDAYIASEMGAAYIRGQQGQDISDPTKVATCMKHYLGYSFPLSGNDRTPAWIPERMIRELFVLPFQAAVNAGTITTMVNSSEINGVPVHASSYYLRTLLRNELGFKGFVVSDWNDINNLYTREMVARDQREAVKLAVLAGIDMSMVPYDYSFYTHLVSLVKDGQVPETRIDEAVRNILWVKYKLGLFENPYPRKEMAQKVGSQASSKVNLAAAREAITVLKNDGKILPLKKGQTILVIGPSADKLSLMCGGWTFTWQADKEQLYPTEKLTILEAIREKAGLDQVRYVKAVEFNREIDIDAAVREAQNSDVVIACIGEPTYCETPGNIRDLTLSLPQLRLIERVAQVGKPIILVLVEGRPRVINQIVDKARGIVIAYLPGLEGGLAVSEILFGEVNPSGKLPFTYPRYPSEHICYDHKKSDETSPNKFDPQWEFGHSLSYTTFAYSNLRLDKSELGQSETLTVSVDVKNTGRRRGKEIVQLFLSDVVASVTPPVKRLKRFTKVELRPAESTTVKFHLGWEDYSFIGCDLKRVVEPGTFTVRVGDLSSDFVVR